MKRLFAVLLLAACGSVGEVASHKQAVDEYRCYRSDVFTMVFTGSAVVRVPGIEYPDPYLWGAVFDRPAFVANADDHDVHSFSTPYEVPCP